MKQFKSVLLPLGIMILAVVVCVVLSEWLLPLGAILLLLQLACAISALVGSRLSGIIAGFIGALSFNYFFTAPLYSFRINQLEDSINFIVFMLVSLLINEVAAYVRKQQRALEVATTQSSMLRSVSHDLRTPLSTIIGSVLGGIMGFLMYMVIFIYGGMVMRSVMEEKINRIVEVMISAAKPFQMMLGKVIGVGGVGLTQLAIWIVLIPLMMMGIQLVFGIGSDPEQLQQLAAAGQELPQELDEYGMEQIFAEIKALFTFLFLKHMHVLIW